MGRGTVGTAEISAVGRRVPLRSGAGRGVTGAPLAPLTSVRSHPISALQELLEDEPVDQLCTAVRYQAMLAIAALRYKPSPWLCHCTPRVRSWVP